MSFSVSVHEDLPGYAEAALCEFVMPRFPTGHAQYSVQDPIDCTSPLSSLQRTFGRSPSTLEGEDAERVRVGSNPEPISDASSIPPEVFLFWIRSTEHEDSALCSALGNSDGEIWAFRRRHYESAPTRLKAAIRYVLSTCLSQATTCRPRSADALLTGPSHLRSAPTSYSGVIFHA